MTATIDEPATDDPPPSDAPSPRPTGMSAALRGLAVVAIAVAFGIAVSWAFDFLKDRDANRFLIVVVALVVGVAGVFAVFWAMDQVVDFLPERFRETIRPYVFVGPALVLLSVFLVYPVINTILLSFKNNNGTKWVGFDNYEFVFTNASMLRSIRNSALWVILVPLVATSVGLVFATLADRLRRGEAVAKSLIFLPMAISFVGAAVTFRLIYSYRPAAFGSNIGLLNGIRLALDQEPKDWLIQQPWNNFLLMAIMVWMQTGFAMVVLSAAIKSIPDDIIEAARIDGASELQVFRKIMIPSILPTIVVVVTYMVINSLKVFDIVFVMSRNPETSGTEVIAERMIRWSFLLQHGGRGAAIAVFLFIVVVPVMIFNIRRFRAEEAIR